ncbi:MAG: ATP-dependent DNA helicase [Lachnospiraceae bacterium]|nr:ATP-dependent DNA helicase [Lachnospiraceae bacterium]
MEARISVRNLIEFILRSGDIDNRIGSFSEQAMQEGGRIHRMIQKRMGADYRAEVPLAFVFHGEEIDITVEGRADGIIENDSGVTIDEIKSTYADVMKYREAQPLHLAQAKFYAYIYCLENDMDEIKVRITYCNIETEEIRYFHETCSFGELTEFVNEVCSAYEKWAKMEIEWIEKRNESIKTLPFPFPYRDGQEELVKQVYYSIHHGKKLFIEAPTGVGKTVSTVYPAVCALGQQKAQKIFYLTAKTITRTVAADCLDILRERGLAIKGIVLTAKEKICLTESKECNPESCPYACGHFDRVNDAVFDMLNATESYTRDTIVEYAQKHRVCPFEMGLDASLFCDFIIGDYNYAFDPRAKLKRFFADGREKQYIFLVDEAHNLVDRAREMYSAVLYKEMFLDIKKLTKDDCPGISKRAQSCNQALLNLKRLCTSQALREPDIDGFTGALLRLYSHLEKVLQDKTDINGKKVKHTLTGEVREQLLEYYFEIFNFLDIYERVDENYEVYCAFDGNGDFYIRLFNVNPCKNLGECMQAARSSILFSATLLPIQYYKELLSGTAEDYEVYAKSVFDPKKRRILVANDVTSKYTRRNETEYTRIANYITDIVRERNGNYMAFFPSYGFMNKVYEYTDFAGCEAQNIEIIVQSSDMKEADREEFLNRFQPENGNEDKSLIGFCVMGGIFSEGIDLKNDALIGAIIVGTGIPQVCLEQDIIKDFFDNRGENGYDYAYRYPGMNKVLQAAGRVIRTEEDIGVVALLDERFLERKQRMLFPREWEDCRVVNLESAPGVIESFWNEWL